MEREFELVIWGCTGYTGKWALDHIVRKYGSPSRDGLMYALAGRDLNKLKQCVNSQVKSIDNVQLIQASLTDEQSIKLMTSRTKVLASFVGPFTLYGEPIVKACIESGTHYVDSTGELSFVKTIFRRYNNLAKEANIKIIPCCGFDYVPSEMMVDRMSRELPVLAKDLSVEPRWRRFDQQFHVSKPTLSAGTVRSAYESLRREPFLHAIFACADGYRLLDNRMQCPQFIRSQTMTNTLFPSYNRATHKYTVPFMMTNFITNYVTWSSELQAYKYNTHTVWSFGLEIANPIRAFLTGFVWLSMTFIMIIASRFNFTRKWIPDSGTGSNVVFGKESFRAVCTAFAPNVSSPKDENLDKAIRYEWNYGNGEAYVFTGMSVIEAGVTLAKQLSELPDLNGVTTPAAGLGDAYLGRLEESGVSMSKVEYVKTVN